MKNVLIILAVLATPHFVSNAFQERGYYAIGGEWLLVPLAFLVGYALIPTINEFLKEVERFERDSRGVKPRRSKQKDTHFKGLH